MTTYNERNRIKAAERKRDKELNAAEKQRLNLEKKGISTDIWDGATCSVPRSGWIVWVFTCGTVK